MKSKFCLIYRLLFHISVTVLIQCHACWGRMRWDKAFMYVYPMDPWGIHDIPQESIGFCLFYQAACMRRLNCVWAVSSHVTIITYRRYPSHICMYVYVRFSFSVWKVVPELPFSRLFIWNIVLYFLLYCIFAVVLFLLSQLLLTENHIWDYYNISILYNCIYSLCPNASRSIPHQLGWLPCSAYVCPRIG